MGSFAGTEFPELLGKMKRGRMSTGRRSRSKVLEGGGRDERVSDGVKRQGCLREQEWPQVGDTRQLRFVACPQVPGGSPGLGFGRDTIE